MGNKKKIKLPLTTGEKEKLRKNKIKIHDIQNLTNDELELMLEVSPKRAKEIMAIIEFQTVPTIGIKFAEDLVFLGYYSLNELKLKNGAELTDEYELKKEYQVDPCVEDQFRLVIYYANTNDQQKKWWDFTEERKKFRMENGYPKNRPTKSWIKFFEE